MPLVCPIPRRKRPYCHAEHVFSFLNVQVACVDLSVLCFAPLHREFNRENVVQVFSSLIAVCDAYKVVAVDICLALLHPIIYVGLRISCLDHLHERPA
ncbi:hypothetical protein D3C76_1671490 [compost metagenome]